MTKNEDLKACPWCNKVASVIHSEDNFDDLVGCRTDGCMLDGFTWSIQEWQNRPTVTPTDRPKIGAWGNKTGGKLAEVSEAYHNNDDATDGDAERALATFKTIQCAGDALDWCDEYEFTIIAALQSTRKPPVNVEHNLGDKIDKEARDILKAVVGLSWDKSTKTITMTPDSFVMCVYQASLPLSMPPVPVDTISIKREVLQGVREALEFYTMFEDRPDEDYNEKFERIGKVFFKETRYLRPGKDCKLHSNSERQNVWIRWLDGKATRAKENLATLDAVLSEGE